MKLKQGIFGVICATALMGAPAFASQGTAEGKTDRAIDTAAEKTKEGVSKTKEGTQKVAEKTKAGAKKVVEKSKDGAVVVVDKTKEGVKKAGDEITDAFLLTSIKTKFIGEDVLKGSDINVDVDRHVVTLRGTVPTEASRARALQIAKSTGGVDSVTDRLFIRPKA